uniref:Secreted protein n=1 Tax=Cacopsylla melanoneura TaxID=428564 RepID=A0A8D8WUF1_9HEMI
MMAIVRLLFQVPCVFSSSCLLSANICHNSSDEESSQFPMEREVTRFVLFVFICVRRVGIKIRMTNSPIFMNKIIETDSSFEHTTGRVFFSVHCPTTTLNVLLNMNLKSFGSIIRPSSIKKKYSFSSQGP